MTTLSNPLRVVLEDLAAQVAHARRGEELGRLALLCYCEIRPWARSAEETRLADRAWALSTQPAPGSRAAFLRKVDLLIAELEWSCERAGLSREAASLRLARAV